MMCDNLSVYSSYVLSTTSMIPSTNDAAQFYPMENDNQYDENRSYTNVKRKRSDYEDQISSLSPVHPVPSTFDRNHGDNHEDQEKVDADDDDDDEDDDEDDEDEDEEINPQDDDRTSDNVSQHGRSITRTGPTPCTITQRRHSDTMYSSSLSYGTPVVKRRCTYSSMHDDEQKRSVLVESYRKLRGVKKPKLQVSLLICNLIKRLERTFTKVTPPRPLQLEEQQQQHLQHQSIEHQPYVQYYQHRTSYRSSSSDSIYMTSSPPMTNEIERSSQINQQYSPPHSSNYDSDKVLLPVNDIRTSSSMYHSSSADAYWLAQSNFAVPVVVPTSEEDDADVSLHGDGDYLDLSDNTLASSFSTCPSSTNSSHSPSPTTSSSSDLISSSISNDCCCSSTTSSTITKLSVDTNNNHQHQPHPNNDYFVYHHHFDHQLHLQHDPLSNHHSSNPGQHFFYHHHHHNGTNTVDIITTA